MTYDIRRGVKRSLFVYVHNITRCKSRGTRYILYCIVQDEGARGMMMNADAERKVQEHPNEGVEAENRCKKRETHNVKQGKLTKR